jgi:hypothetical protein
LLVDTCTQGGMVGRLAERRLVLNQPVEEVGRHGAIEEENARVRCQAYISTVRLDLCHKASMLRFAWRIFVSQNRQRQAAQGPLKYDVGHADNNH